MANTEVVAKSKAKRRVSRRWKGKKMGRKKRGVLVIVLRHFENAQISQNEIR
jgi:hypothetical protein